MNSLFSKIDIDNTDDFLFIISTKYLKNAKIEPINIQKGVSNSDNKIVLMKLLSIGDGEIGVNINSNCEDISELLEGGKPEFEYYIYKLENSKEYKSPLDLLNLDYSLMRITYISLSSLSESEYKLIGYILSTSKGLSWLHLVSLKLDNISQGINILNHLENGVNIDTISLYYQIVDIKDYKESVRNAVNKITKMIRMIDFTFEKDPAEC